MARSSKKIFDLINDLPEEKKKEVIDFAEYLRFREIEQAGVMEQVKEALKDVESERIHPARDLLNAS